VSLYPSGCLCTIAPIRESGGKKKPETVTVKPDFLVIRNQPRGPTPATDNRNALFALVAAGIPAVNSLQSCMLDLERASMVGEMLRLQRLAPSPADFPVIPISFYSHCMRMPMYDSGFPAILKVSHAHAGMGKAKIASSEGLHDAATVLALHGDYASLEPFIAAVHGIRVQKIGPHYRVYKKVFTGSGWKSQFGGADLQLVPLTDEFKRWADLAALSHGGSHMLAVDAVVDGDGNKFIIEINGTAIGIQQQFWQEDSLHVAALALRLMNESLVPLHGSTGALQDVSNQCSAHQVMELEEEIRQLRARVQQLQAVADSVQSVSSAPTPSAGKSFLGTLFN
jgi:glutathione synthase/RimK-type ligase-like ATP-grasp enzyme